MERGFVPITVVMPVQRSNKLSSRLFENADLKEVVNAKRLLYSFSR